MSRSISSIRFGFAMLAAGLPAQGWANTPEELSAPTPIDFGDVRKKTDALIADIIANKGTPTLRAALSENALLAEKTSQINLLVTQYESLVETYGKPEQCVGLEQSYRSSLRITTSYVCQHRDLLVRWLFEVDRLPKGWTYSNISFKTDF